MKPTEYSLQQIEEANALFGQWDNKTTEFAELLGQLDKLANKIEVLENNQNPLFQEFIARYNGNPHSNAFTFVSSRRMVRLAHKAQSMQFWDFATVTKRLALNSLITDIDTLIDGVIESSL